MPLTENPTANTNNEKSLPFSQLEQLESVHDAIVQLDVDEGIWRSESKEYRERSRIVLDSIKAKLRELYPKYKDDPDYVHLTQMYRDLESDWEDQQPLNLDSSFGDILMESKSILQELPITSSTKIDQLPEGSRLLEVARKAQSLGLNIDRFVDSGDPTAPVVILFPKPHPNKGLPQELLDLFRVEESQNEVAKFTRLFFESGLSRSAFTEGAEKNKMHSDESAIKDSELGLGVAKARVQIGQDLKVHGFENHPMLKKAVVENNHPIIRQALNNLIIASNVAEVMRKNKYQVSSLSIGLLHEKDIFETMGPLLSDSQNDETQHPLPLSSLFAANGISVIVASPPKLNVHDIEEYISTHQSEIQKAQQSFQKAGIDF